MKEQVARRGIVVGVFDDERDAKDAIRDLKLEGFGETHIGIAAPTNTQSPIFHDDSSKTAAAGAVAGLGAGALWGIGIVAGILPGIGPAIFGGTIASIIASATVGAATAGLAGAFIGLGMASDDAKFIEDQFKAGKIVVTVQAGDRGDLARAMMERYRAASMCPILDAH